MSVNSKQKGKRGEREVANFLKEYGFEARRGQQFCGSNGDADVIGLPKMYIEVKFVENLNVLKALQQAINDKPKDTYPVVFHRQKRQKLKVTMRTQDFIDWTTGECFYLPDSNYLTLLATDFMDLYKLVESW